MVWEPDFKLFKNPPFHKAIAAIGTLIFAYGGIPAFFSVIAEMKDPRDFRKSLAMAQTVLTVMYLVSEYPQPMADSPGRRYRSVLLLRKLRLEPSSWQRRCSDEEGVLRTRTAWYSPIHRAHHSREYHGPCYRSPIDGSDSTPSSFPPNSFSFDCYETRGTFPPTPQLTG